MTDPTTGREALIAELIGDVARLLDRVDAIVAALDAGAVAIVQAGNEMQAKATQVDERIAAMTEAAKILVIQHIARQAEEAARGTRESQTRVMQATAQELFRAELAPALRRLAHVADHASKHARWWACAGAAAVASGATCALTLCWLAR